MAIRTEQSLGSTRIVTILELSPAILTSKALYAVGEVTRENSSAFKFISAVNARTYAVFASERTIAEHFERPVKQVFARWAAEAIHMPVIVTCSLIRIVRESVFYAHPIL